MYERSPMQVSTSHLKLERQDRVRDFIHRFELDVLILLSGGARGQRGNVRYVSNYSTSSQSSVVLWARDGSPRLIVPYSVHRLWAEATSWIQDIQVEADYPRAIARYLQEQGLGRARIGWVGPAFLLEGVRVGFDALYPNAENLMLQGAFASLRLVKTPEELKLVRRCGQIADQVLSRIQQVLCPGVTERDLVAEAEYVARRQGCEGASILLSRGTLMAQPIPREPKLESGDILQFSIEPEGPGGMWVQTVRMFALGEPPADWMRLIDAAVQAEKRAAALLHDGCPAADVAQAMSALLPGQAPLITPLGHGIGLDNSEPPRMSTESGETLSTGMAIVLHPTEYGEKTAVFLGNTYLVEKHGAERLSQTTSDLVIL